MSESKIRLERENADLRRRLDGAWKLLMLPSFKRERLLAELPMLIGSMAPQQRGPDYDMARSYHEQIALAVARYIQEASA